MSPLFTRNPQKKKQETRNKTKKKEPSTQPTMSGTSPTPLLLVADQLAVENPTYPIRIDKTPIILATWLSFLPTVDQKADPSAMGYCCFECSDSHLGQPVCAGRTAPWTPIDDEIIRLPCRCLWRRGCLEWRLNPDGDDSDLC